MGGGRARLSQRGATVAQAASLPFRRLPVGGARAREAAVLSRTSVPSPRTPAQVSNPAVHVGPRICNPQRPGQRSGPGDREGRAFPFGRAAGCNLRYGPTPLMVQGVKGPFGESSPHEARS